MSPTVDSAILKALGLESNNQAKITSHGAGSGFASTFKLTCTTTKGTTAGDDQTRDYFVKTGTGEDANVMFEGEHASLNAIHDIVPSFCPKSYAHGTFSSEGQKHFLVTDFLDLSSSKAFGGKGSELSLAAKLAKQHTTPAPVPQGHKAPMFGFPVTTCCGDTPQDNTWKASWVVFYADNRLRHILKRGAQRNGADKELAKAVETTASKVVPRLIGAVMNITPVVVHGDLWSGNHSRGRIGVGGAEEEVVFDPSAVYGHSEYELGIMNMFGGFGNAFWKEYLALVPKAEPSEEWEDRVKLYELYHHLNHYAIFGGGYRGGALGIMKRLISKYGQ